jgi:flagellar motor protein MotB
MREEETDTEGTWAVSYGDMVTLLLTFFILFFSLDPAAKKSTGGEQDKPNPLSLSLMGSLNKFAANTAQPDGVPVGGDPKSKKADMTGAGPGAGAGASAGNGPGTTASAAGDAEGNNQNTGLVVDRDFLVKTKATILKSGQKVIIDFPDISFFKSGKIPLTKAGRKILKTFVDTYTPYMGSYNLVIQAYADTKKVKNNKNLKFSDNLELSALRGVATLRFLQESGIPIRNMKVAGYGEVEVTKLKLSAMAKNKSNPKYLLGLARRVVIVIEPLEMPI